MCGIAGFAGIGQQEDLMAMIRMLVHRGPDAEGVWYDKEKGVYLGHRRLSIIDLEGGAQPMWTSDAAIGIVFNGEIYNHQELRGELEKVGYRFLTDHSDTEVLLHGYGKWGKDLPQKLNGMWAFALYDRIRNELFLSRDRFGKKPLFYSLQNGTFAFASELSAIVKHKNIKSNVSTKSLRKYFAYGYIPAPHSLYENIYKLPGGCNLVLKLPEISYSVYKYWDFVIEPFERIQKNSEREWEERIRALLLRAVEYRLMSDVPLGIFLSGGIDSSSIAAFAVQISGKEKVKSFSIGFEEASFDESFYSRKIASFLGTAHYLETLSIEAEESRLFEIVKKLDEPMGDSSLFPTYLLCREARKHVTVVLGGDGGDELFAGYDPFQALRFAELYSRIVPKPVHLGIRMLSARLPTSHQNISLDFKIKRVLRGLSYHKKLWNPVWLGPLEPSELEELFEEPIDIEEVYSEAIEQWDACLQKNIIDKTLQFYTKLYLQDNILTKVDRASMMHSLEVRAPYLDINLVNFVRHIPHQYKFRNGQTKYILKKALEPLLPHEILYRPKKGFGVPIGRWFKEGRLGFDDEILSANFAPQFLRKRFAEQQKGSHDHRLYLWNQWVLNNYLHFHHVGMG